jgi:hypothetical protein
MRHKLPALLLLLLSASPFAARQEQPGKPEAEEELLMRTVANPGSSAPSVDSAFQTAIHGSGTAGGGDTTSVSGGTGKRCPLPRKHAERGLDDIVAADSDYVWRVKDDAVNLLPAKGIPSLLRVRIREFDSGDTWSSATVGARLFDLPEVQERATELGLSQRLSGSALGAIVPGTASATPLNVHLRDVTLLDALNAVLRAAQHGLWIYRETHCKSENTYMVYYSGWGKEEASPQRILFLDMGYGDRLE